MEEDLLNLLRQNSSLIELVGDRIEWGERVQGGGFPAVTLTLVDKEVSQTMKGPVSLVQFMVQVDSYGLTYETTKLVARLVENQLNGYRGGDFSGIFLQTSRDFRVGGVNEPDRPFRTSLDFSIFYET